MEDEDLMGMGMPPEEGAMTEEPMMEEPMVDGMPMEDEEAPAPLVLPPLQIYGLPSMAPS